MKKLLISAYALSAMVAPSFAQEAAPTTAIEALAAAAAVVTEEKEAVNTAEEAESLALATKMRKDFALQHLAAIEKELARSDKGASYKYTMYWEKFYLLEEQCYLAEEDADIIASLTALKTIMNNSAGIEASSAAEMSTAIDASIAEFYEEDEDDADEEATEEEADEEEEYEEEYEEDAEEAPEAPAEA